MENTKHYICPMHPDVREDAPGSCPQCGMDLVEVSAKGGSASGGKKDDDH